MNARSSWNMRAALGLMLGASLISTAVAQTSASDDKKDEPLKLDKFVVTGSLIPRAAGEPAVPITTIDAVAIERSGVATDLLEVLKKTEPYFYGANNVGSENGNVSSGSTNGGSAVALRNRATLVLINGRRAAISPVLGSGGGQFVDVSLIPISMVDKIEVLSDGASATYGSDAVSGVVNVILKTNFQGAEVGGRYGWSPNDGNYAERSYYLIAGAGAGKTNVTVSTDWKKTDPLIQYERGFSQRQFRTPTYAGIVSIGTAFYYLNPSLNAPPANTDMTPEQLVAAGIYSGPMDQTAATQFFDLSAYPTMKLATDRRSVVAAVNHEITDYLNAFADFIYTVSDTRSVLNAQPVSGTVAGSTASNPFVGSVTARNRFVKFPRVYENESTGTRGIFGLRGSIPATSWNFEAAANFNRTVHHFRNHNLIDAVAYTAAVTSGAYNPFARNQAAGVIESFLGTSYRDYVSELVGLDARVTGELFQLPAGAVQVGFGAETRRETLKFNNDRYDQTGQWLQATPRLPYYAQQSTDGFFAEARVPIFDKPNAIPGVQFLELSVAARKDIYSKTSDPTVPKYSIRWRPFNDELSLRATYSESFSAPDLFSLTGPVTAGFTSSINITRYNSSGVAIGASGSRQYRSRSGSNANLTPSESRNWTAGVVWSPKGALKNLELSADWYNIDERDLISTIPSTTIVQSVEQLGAASPYAPLVRQAASVAGETHFDDGAPITAPGQVTARPSDEIWISNQSVNVAGVWQSGLDLKAQYTYETNNWGRFVGAVTGVYLHDYFVQNLPGGTAYNYTDSFSGTSTYPRYRTYTRLDWMFKSFQAGIAHTWIPEVDDVAALTLAPVDGFQSFDVTFGYRFSSWGNKWLEGLSCQVGVNNVFNEEPPYAASEGNQNRDINTYDPIGRFIYAQVKYKF